MTSNGEELFGKVESANVGHREKALALDRESLPARASLVEDETHAASAKRRDHDCGSSRSSRHSWSSTSIPRLRVDEEGE